MMTPSMRLVKRQRDREFRRTLSGLMLPETEGDVAFCQNLREYVSGELNVTGVPRQVMESKDRVVGIDVRGDITTIFCQSEDNQLKIAGTLDDHSNFTVSDDLLDTLSQGVKRCSSVGAFVVFMLEDGRLYYLLWDYDLLCYRVLGELPEVPQNSIAAVGATDFTATVENVTFKDVVEDMRASMPTEVVAQVGDKLEKAWQSVTDKIRNAGMWVQPVEVRLVYRMWDGQVLHVTSPTLVGVGYQGYSRLMVPLRSDTTGFIGTSDVAMTVKGYRISVGAAKISANWSDVVAQVEVWVSKEQEVVKIGSMPTMSQVQSGSTYYLSSFLPTYVQSDLSAAISTTPVGRHSFYASQNAIQVQLMSTARVNYVATPPEASEIISHVDCMHGRGDFLHLVKGLSLVTMRRGNPLSAASTTESVGGKVYAISSQCIGGGAYTRQFIYLFTDHGIVALTHKADGSHTNCRVISPAIVDHQSRVVATSSGVYAMSVNGELLLLRDAKVYVLLSGIGLCRQLGWDSYHNELWLVPDLSTESWRCSLVLQIYNEYRAYLSTTIPQSIVSSEGLLLYEQMSDNGVVLMNLSDEYVGGEQNVESRWISSTIEFAEGEVMTRLDVGAAGSGLYMTVNVMRVMGLSPVSQYDVPIVSATVTGDLHSMVALRPLPTPKSMSNLKGNLRCYVDIYGRFNMLNGLRFDTRLC